jgi:NAD+ synthase
MNPVLAFDCEQAAEEICQGIRQAMVGAIGRRGLVLGISGGIDSSVCAALAVRALGKDKVIGLLMPEQDSAPESGDLGELLARHLGVRYETQSLSAALESLGCYRWRDDAIRELVSEYGDGWRNKIVIRGGMDGQINRYELVVEDPEGNRQQVRLPVKQYLQIVAATNFKQRIRKTLEYCWADRFNYAVLGTPNRLEYDQGFFVKHGDGAADIKPIAHLYKSQVYALARHLGLPDAICNSTPTTDTYSLAQGQDEFYFALPYERMDVALFAFNASWPASRLATEIQVSEEQANWVFGDIARKRKTTRYLHAAPVLLESVPLESVSSDL